MKDTLVHAAGLSKSLGGKRVVSDVSFSVKKGEVVGFLGPNGAGKTTTMRMLTGFLEPDAGEIVICNHSIKDEPLEVKRHIGYLPESGALYPDILVKDFVAYIADIRQLDPSVSQARQEYIIRRLQLGGVWFKPVYQLSKGYKRRLMLAQALLHDPSVLVLDEPTDGLDPNQKEEVQELIEEIAKDKAIIISTHIMDEVELLCSRAIILAGGRTIVSGTIAELIEKAKIPKEKPQNLTNAFKVFTQ